MRLHAKTLILFCATGLAILTIVGAIQFVVLKERTLSAMSSQIGGQLGHLDFSVAHFLQDVERDVLGLAADQRIRTREDEAFTSFLDADASTFQYNITPREEEIISVLHTFYLTHPYVNSAYMGRENGSFVRSHKRASPTRYDPRDRPWYLLAKQHPGQVVRTSPYPSVTAKDINIGVVVSMLDEHGKLFGVVGTDITLSTLTRYISSFQISFEGQVMLLDDDGTVLASRDQTMLFKNVKSLFANGEDLLRSDSVNAPFLLLDAPQEQYQAYVHNSTGTGWKFAGLVPRQNIQAHIKKLVFDNLKFLTAAIALLSIVTIFGLKFSVLGPIGNLTSGTQIVRLKGDLNYRFNVGSKDEIRELADAFNQMLEALDSSTRELRSSRQALQDERNLLDERVKARTTELESLNSTLQREVEERTRAEQAAEQANQAKSHFLASMSHEIRTPLNAVLGFTQLLLMDEQLGKSHRQTLETVYRSGEHLLALLNDILEMSKIEAGRVELHPVHFDLWAALDDQQATFAVLARQAGLTFEVVRTEDLPRWVFADEQKLRQVLHNLLGNALKFTSTGGVVLRAKNDTDTNGTRLVFEVEDSGPGIPEESRESVFQTFEQLSADKGRKGGTGLGLAISKAYVELMGGSIVVRGEMGVGSIFAFEIPFEPGSVQDAKGKQTANRVVRLADGQGEKRVLVVDDNVANREILSRMLSLAGFTVREASEGQAACKEFQSWHPHLILLDMIMPVMDGFEVLQHLQTTEAGRAVPVIAVTASVLQEDEERVLAAGASAFLKKPFKSSELYTLLQSLLRVKFQEVDEAVGLPQEYTPITPDMSLRSLATLSEQTRTELLEAAISLDTERMTLCIGELADKNHEAAAILERLANEFRFNAIQELLTASDGHAGESPA